MLYSICFLAEYVTDPRTKKQYIVLETSTLNHDVNQATCRNNGGYLPEPRDEEENLFLDSLGSDKFVLGIRQVNGQWVFDSDESEVTWKSWAHWANYPDPPRGGACVAMLRNHEQAVEGTRSQDWFDIPCKSKSYLDNRPSSLVCQKYSKYCFEYLFPFCTS